MIANMSGIFNAELSADISARKEVLDLIIVSELRGSNEVVHDPYVCHSQDPVGAIAIQ